MNFQKAIEKARLTGQIYKARSTRSSLCYIKIRYQNDTLEYCIASMPSGGKYLYWMPLYLPEQRMVQKQSEVEWFEDSEFLDSPLSYTTVKRLLKNDPSKMFFQCHTGKLVQYNLGAYEWRLGGSQIWNTWNDESQDKYGNEFDWCPVLDLTEEMAGLAY